MARDLLGTVLARSVAGMVLRGRIVETEAYTGQSDPGSHAYRGVTPRTAVMFGRPGHLYVYVSYGMHFCMNVVTDTEGVAGAVLVRALEPLDGIKVMRQYRGNRPTVDLCNGPGKLCQAFGITRDQNGLDLENGDIWIEAREGAAAANIAVTARVGLSAGAELPLRFFVKDSRYVSRGKPSA